MTVTDMAFLLLKASFFASLVAVGTAASLRDLMAPVRNPRRWLRGLLAMQIAAPVLAIAMVLTLPLSTPVRIALVLVAVSPVPPRSPTNACTEAESRSYSASLLSTSVLLAVVLTPLALTIIGAPAGFGRDSATLSFAIRNVVALLVPFLVGRAIHAAAPQVSVQVSRVLSRLGTILLVLAVLPLAAMHFVEVRQLATSVIVVVMFSWCVGSLLIGHVLGGADREERTALALSTATRHPGFALPLALAEAPHDSLAVAAILLFVFAASTCAELYLFGLRRHAAPRLPQVAPHP
jgi:bile acid:Na+ symporter, BASS family